MKLDDNGAILLHEFCKALGIEAVVVLRCEHKNGLGYYWFEVWPKGPHETKEP